MKTGRAVIIDASSSGVSGDKFLGALVDLGGNMRTLGKIARTVEKNLPDTDSVRVETRRVDRGDIGARLVSVVSDEKVSRRNSKIVVSVALKCAKALGFSAWAEDLVWSIFDSLLAAEIRVHGHATKALELHELGSADTLVDVLGVAFLAEELGLSKAEWWCSPIAVGTGVANFSERSYPNPPPAVAEILRAHKFPTKLGGVQHELTTPTGAAIAVNLAGNRNHEAPIITPDKIGYGAGSKVANILRLTTGKLSESDHTHDKVVVLETNLDDVSGEIIGRAVEKLMEAGARDVSITPVFMKKNRPGQLISVIADQAKSEQLAELLMDETGTLGVREIPVSRHISRRSIGNATMEVKGRKFQVRMKRALGAQSGKVEYEDLRRISNATGISIRELQEAAKTRDQHKH